MKREIKRGFALFTSLLVAAGLGGCGGRSRLELSGGGLGLEISEGELLISGGPGFSGVVAPVINGEEFGPFEAGEGLSLRLPLPENGGTLGLLAGPEGEAPGPLAAECIKIEKSGSGLRFATPPELKENKKKLFTNKDSEAALLPSAGVQSDSEALASAAQDMTVGAKSDYDRARAVYRWITENMYLDPDSGFTDAESAYRYRRGGGLAWANLYAALTRSLGIPCRVREGRVLSPNGGETACWWNEVRTEEGWIIADALSGCRSVYRDGQYLPDEFVTETYFDADVTFFSYNHKWGAS